MSMRSMRVPLVEPEETDGFLDPVKSFFFKIFGSEAAKDSKRSFRKNVQSTLECIDGIDEKEIMLQLKKRLEESSDITEIPEFSRPRLRAVISFLLDMHPFLKMEIKDSRERESLFTKTDVFEYKDLQFGQNKMTKEMLSFWVTALNNGWRKTKQDFDMDKVVDALHFYCNYGLFGNITYKFGKHKVFVRASDESEFGFWTKLYGMQFSSKVFYNTIIDAIDFALMRFDKEIIEYIETSDSCAELKDYHENWRSRINMVIRFFYLVIPIDQIASSDLKSHMAHTGLFRYMPREDETPMYKAMLLRFCIETLSSHNQAKEVHGIYWKNMQIILKNRGDHVRVGNYEEIVKAAQFEFEEELIKEGRYDVRFQSASESTPGKGPQKEPSAPPFNPDASENPSEFRPSAPPLKTDAREH